MTLGLLSSWWEKENTFLAMFFCNFLLYIRSGRALICNLYKNVSSMSRVYCWSMGVVDSPEGYSVILDIGRYGTIKQNRQCQKDVLIIDIRS